MSREAQRVRIGLTGLAVVFLAVLLAAVFTRASNEEPLTANRIEEVVGANQDALPDPEVGEPNEPLAELGVAPGKEEPAKPAPTAPPSRPRR